MDFTQFQILLGIYGGLFLYPILQVFAIWRTRGWWRALALLPLVAMLPVLFSPLLNLAHGSNMWPVLLIFAVWRILGVLAYLIGLLVADAILSRTLGSNHTVCTGYLKAP